MDLLKPRSFPGVIQEAAPDVIVHAAAVTLPDECEKDRPKAYAINVTATQHLLESAPPAAIFIYISTDLVFDGEKGNYTELDERNPINYYGETKVQAEDLVMKRPRSVVLRVAKLFSHGSPFHSCFTNWMREHLVTKRQLRLFKDQYRTPVSVRDVSRALVRLVERGPAAELYHLGGPERLSRYDFGLIYAEVFGLPVDTILPVSMTDVGLVPRGRDCSLDSTRLRDDLGFEPLPLRAGLAELTEYEAV
jgi:dTDP-4-dehydrorhamnose reductase